MVTWLHRYMVTWLHRYMVTSLHGYRGHGGIAKGGERGCSGGFLWRGFSAHQEGEEVGGSGGCVGVGRQFRGLFFGDVVATGDEVLARGVGNLGGAVHFASNFE